VSAHICEPVTPRLIVLCLTSSRFHREYRRRSTPPVTPPRYALRGQRYDPDRRGSISVSVVIAADIKAGRRKSCPVVGPRGLPVFVRSAPAEFGARGCQHPASCSSDIAELGGCGDGGVRRPHDQDAGWLVIGFDELNAQPVGQIDCTLAEDGFSWIWSLAPVVSGIPGASGAATPGAPLMLCG
jgi:hypothetical protein